MSKKLALVFLNPMRMRRKKLKIKGYLLVKLYEIKSKPYLFLNYLEILFSLKLTKTKLNRNLRVKFPLT